MLLKSHVLPAATPAGPPVVLLHGFTSSANQGWLAADWGTVLNDAGRTVIAIDLPAHGDSPGLDSIEQGSTRQVIAAIVAAINAATNAAQVDVIGYSLGARLAWELPAATPKIRRLVLGGLSPFEPFASIEADALQAALSGAATQNPMVDMMAGMISQPGLDTSSLVHLIHGLASEPFAADANTPTVPTLFVAGQDDQMAQGIEELVALIDGATLQQVPGDHFAAQASTQFQDAAIRFLDQA